MRREIVRLLSKQVLRDAISNKSIVVLMLLVGALMIYSTITSISAYRHQSSSQAVFQKEVREHWEAMPDKHPHRMAHYGYIAFRTRNPLSIFDFGTENYTGNAIFLEAHKQNSANFSEAGFSTGMLRFGEISLATILQVLVPLIIFFIGFGTIAADRENGTLKLLISQGVSWKELIMGKSVGLAVISVCFLLAAFLLLVTGIVVSGAAISADTIIRIFILLVTYLLYFAIISIIAALISGYAKKAKTALVALIGCWLLFAIVLPRTMQAAGSYIYQSPSRIAFETEVEKEILKLGDSHDPNDTYYKKLKDSVLKANKVVSVQQLSFNYSGFQMREGERLSAEVYNTHLAKLLEIYKQQNNVFRISAFLNPFAAVRNISMGFSGTDFRSYTRFQEQAEDYRYKLAQHMNELQIKLISNKTPGENDKPYSISSDNWKAFPDYRYEDLSAGKIASMEMTSLLALISWLILVLMIAAALSKSLKAI